ncbi:MAG: DUF4266 domain-containing protein [Bacteroidetes bacterium]|nr:DUF4266 domain-containing protein [Bacteroidota bacterium]
MRFRLFFIFILLVGFFFLTGCTAVKPWQQVYLNDPEMQLSSSSGGVFEDYVHAIRTGSTVAGSKKSTGGCGCN